MQFIFDILILSGQRMRFELEPQIRVLDYPKLNEDNTTLTLGMEKRGLKQS
jgi:hypothetical protein